MFKLFLRSYSKVFKSSREAVEDITSGSQLAVGGFGNCGIPENLIYALSKRKVYDLELISNNCGSQGYGIHHLFIKRMVKKIMASYVGDNDNFEWRFMNGDIEVEYVPQGSLAEKLRAGGAGIPAFFTQVGAGTPISEGNFQSKMSRDSEEVIKKTLPKEVRTINGELCVLEEALRPDFAFIKAWKGDTLGNLVYRGTARNFNPLMAMAAKTTIAEVEVLVEPGELDPSHVHTPSVFVQRVVKGEKYDKIIERLTLDGGSANSIPGRGLQKKNRKKIIERAVKELRPGMIVNLGIGIPTLIPQFVPTSLDIRFHSETGIIGTGLYPKPGDEDPDIINGGKETCTVTKGAAFFDSAESGAIMRGGHLDLSFVGGIQISRNGDLANWYVSARMIKGCGANLEIAASKSKIIVLMEHSGKNNLRIVEELNLPITGKNVVSMLITELGVFHFVDGNVVLTEISKETTLDQIRNSTECDFQIASNLVSF